jgi:hypothetical protein
VTLGKVVALVEQARLALMAQPWPPYCDMIKPKGLLDIYRSIAEAFAEIPEPDRRQPARHQQNQQNQFCRAIEHDLASG